MSINKDLIRKVGVITFLVLLVLGFTVPGIVSIFQEDQSVTPPKTEPRLCHTDSDCYLTCNGTPVSVLCLNNICQQNSCDEYSLFSLREEPLNFFLTVMLENKPLSLENRTQSGNFFVQFAGNEVQAFTRGLYLTHILEKVNIVLDETCLHLDDSSYCSSASKKVKVNINGNVTNSYMAYAPKEADRIEIVYG